MAASHPLTDVSLTFGVPLAVGSVTSRTGGALGWALAWIAGVPVCGSAPARLEIRGSDRGDVWTRTFGRRRQVSVMRILGDGVEERFGWLAFELALVSDAELRLLRTRVGPFAFGPRLFALLTSTTRDGSQLQCRVDATLLGGRLGRLRYEIDVRQDPEGDAR